MLEVKQLEDVSDIKGYEIETVEIITFGSPCQDMCQQQGKERDLTVLALIYFIGTDTHSICYETHQKAKDNLEGRKIDPTFYHVIYGADEKDDWTDPEF